MLIRILTALSVAACFATGTVSAAGKISHTHDHFEKPAKSLETALHRFERDLAGKRGQSRARSSKPKEIVVVGSKVKDVVRSPRARPGGFGSVSGLDSTSDVVEFREGGPASLPKLQAAIRSFESAAGPRSPCIRSCKAAQRRCLTRCRRALGAGKIRGRCVCEHEHARCLVQAARRGECMPPDLR